MAPKEILVLILPSTVLQLNRFSLCAVLPKDRGFSVSKL